MTVFSSWFRDRVPGYTPTDGRPEPAQPPQGSGSSPADRLEAHMHSAIARGDAALAAYTYSRNVQHLIDGLLDVRVRLMKGLP